jgi:poly(A)-specific ribonuclease
MDVTNDNFEAVLKELETIIPVCDFAAIDMEFTGLSGFKRFERSNSDESPAVSLLTNPGHSNATGTDEDMTNDTRSKHLERKYQEVRSAGNFLVIQVGVCPFTWNEKSGEFIAHPFNFYTFPREVRGHDPRFLCQTTSMAFLAEKGHFDFNKLIRSGIPFLSHEQEALVRSSSVVDPDHDGFIVELREKIITFLIAGEPANLLLPPADSYRRKLTYQELGSTFKDVVTTERQCADSGEVSIRVSRVKHWNRILGSTAAQVFTHACFRHGIGTLWL